MCILFSVKIWGMKLTNNRVLDSFGRAAHDVLGAMKVFIPGTTTSSKIFTLDKASDDGVNFDLDPAIKALSSAILEGQKIIEETIPAHHKTYFDDDGLGHLTVKHGMSKSEGVSINDLFARAGKIPEIFLDGLERAGVKCREVVSQSYGNSASVIYDLLRAVSKVIQRCINSAPLNNVTAVTSAYDDTLKFFGVTDFAKFSESLNAFNSRPSDEDVDSRRILQSMLGSYALFNPR